MKQNNEVRESFKPSDFPQVWPVPSFWRLWKQERLAALKFSVAHGEIDEEMRPYLDAINACDDVVTVGSCVGHWKKYSNRYRVWYDVQPAYKSKRDNAELEGALFYEGYVELAVWRRQDLFYDWVVHPWLEEFRGSEVHHGYYRYREDGILEWVFYFKNRNWRRQAARLVRLLKKFDSIVKECAYETL